MSEKKKFLDLFEITTHEDGDLVYTIYQYDGMTIVERTDKADVLGTSREVKFIPDIDGKYSIDVVSVQAGAEIAEVINRHRIGS